ncbi:polymorphic toxin-type HINT domain-containing protein [Fusibacter bizertensis]|uniref:Polymorphic toxin-type HINT domain-containing protein n=1 Tax=Fusibacter bizertensis TaxID=1488331 RepID=A0ABT6N9B0_9FIRM|nr:polymorphic toxin-type HINT domain-containing protein [Fusibacter bizertensis]MDH8677005.1 polymorphic toxin-type HINT domain-containing protein [Fusibacter bizertensis]
MKKVISKVLIFTVLWTSLFSGGAQMAFAAPNTKTVIENDYTVDYEQGDYDIVESDSNAAILSNKSGLNAISSSQNVDVYKDGQWTKETEKAVTWSPDSTVDPSKSYVSDSIGLGWSDVNKVQITFSEASNVPQTNSGSQGAYTPTMQPLASTAMKASTVSSGYGDSVNFNSPTMQAASVQANSSAAPSDDTTGWTRESGTYYGYEVGFGNDFLYEKYTQEVVIPAQTKLYNLQVKDTSPYEGKLNFSSTSVKIPEEVKTYVDVPDTSKPPSSYEQKSVIIQKAFERLAYRAVRVYIPTTYKTVQEWVPPVVEMKRIWKPAVYKSVTKIIQPAIYGTRTRTVAATYKTVIVTAGHYKWVLDSKSGEPKQVWVPAVTKRVVDKPAYSYTETYLISPEEKKVVQELVTPGKWVDEPNIIQNGYYKDVRVVDKEGHYDTEIESYTEYVHAVWGDVDDLTKPIYPNKTETIITTKYVDGFDISYDEIIEPEKTQLNIKYVLVDNGSDPNPDPNPSNLSPLQMNVPNNLKGSRQVGTRYVGVTSDGYEFVVQVIKEGDDLILQADENFIHTGRLDSLDCQFYAIEKWEEMENLKDIQNPTVTELIHGIMDIVGFFPEPISTLSDVLNTLLYIAEQVESFITGGGDNFAFDIICGILSLGLVGLSVSALKGFLSAPVGKITSNSDAVMKVIKETFVSASEFKSNFTAKIVKNITENVDEMFRILESSNLFKIFGGIKAKLTKIGDDIKKLFAEKADEIADEIKKVDEKIIGAGCLVAGMLIYTSEGYKPVETIKTGDLVFSKNTENGNIELKEVYGTYVGFKQELYTLYTDKGIITATEEHPFWVDGKGWVEAKELTNMDRLVDLEDQIVTISKIQHDTTNGTKIFNLSVTDNHNYFVGNGNILTHNINCAQLDPRVSKVFGEAGDLDVAEYQKLLDDIASGKISKEEADMIKAQIADLNVAREGKYVDELKQLDEVIEGTSKLAELISKSQK